MNFRRAKVPSPPAGAGTIARVAVLGGSAVYAALNSLSKVKGGHRAIVFNRIQGIQGKVTHGNLQLNTGHNCLSNRHFSLFNEFSKQLKGEANSNPEFKKSINELNEKIGVVKEDLKVRTKTTAEKLYKSVDEVWTEAEATSKKVSANVKEKLSAAKEEVKETFGLGKEENAGFQTESTKASTASDKADSSTHSTDQSQDSSSTATLFSRLKSTLSSATPVVSNAFQKLKETKVSNLAKQGYDIVKDELSSSKTKKKHMRHATPTSGEKSTRTDVVIVPTKKSVVTEKWEAFKKKMQDHPIFKQVNEYTKPVVTMSQELAEDARERWETSDNPIVHKIQDLNETVFGETATAISFKEIRRRDPTFSLPDFVAEVQETIRPVLVAHAKGDVETLKKHCTDGFIERCKAERQAYQAHGIFFDNKILHISDADVAQTKIINTTPIIIVVFQTQQIHCVRDKDGQITAGGQDTIQTVYYQWAMQLMDSEELGENTYYPGWRLCEMGQHNVQTLI